MQKQLSYLQMIKGIGTDIVQNERVNEKLAKRLLTENEYKVYEQKVNKNEYLASRFAAKEAIIKATNKTYGCTQIELLNDENGKLHCNISGIHISISHEKDYCVAFAVWESNE